MKAQRFLLVGLAVLVAAAVLVLSTLQKDDLRIGYMNITAHAPFVAALELGLFERRGLSVDERPYPDTPTLMSALADGVIDVAYQVTPDFVWGQKSDGFLAYLVAASDTLRPIDALLARAGFTIPPSGVVRVGHFPGPTAAVMTRNIMASVLQGDTVGRMEVFAVPPSLQLQFLEQARIDLLFTYEPLVTLATARVGAVVLLSAPVERIVLAGAPWYGGVGVVSEELVRLKSRAVEALLMALRDAVDTLEVDSSLRARLLAELQPGLPVELAEGIPVTRTLLADNPASRDSIEAGLVRQLDLYRSLGIIPATGTQSVGVYRSGRR